MADPNHWGGGAAEKAALLEVARRSLERAAERGEALRELPENEILRRAGGAFVTLRKKGALRGCIGQLPGRDALAEVVARCTREAALEDPRFPPVAAEEAGEIGIEISVLSRPEAIGAEEIVIGRDGLLVSRGGQRGLLLPQVAVEFRWGRERFLEETCAKGGFARGAWKEPGMRIEAFRADVFAEA